MTIDPQQFGRVMQKVDDFIPLMEKHINASDVRHDDTERRVDSLEEDRRFLRRALVVMGIVWPLLYPILKEVVLNILFKGGNGLEAMLSYDYLIRIL